MELILFLVSFWLYFLPSFVARNKKNLGAILALNFLLGWTVIGWVVALVWALVKDNDANIPTLYNAVR